MSECLYDDAQRIRVARVMCYDIHVSTLIFYAHYHDYQGAGAGYNYDLPILHARTTAASDIPIELHVVGT